MILFLIMHAAAQPRLFSERLQRRQRCAGCAGELGGSAWRAEICCCFWRSRRLWEAGCAVRSSVRRVVGMVSETPL